MTTSILGIGNRFIWRWTNWNGLIIDFEKERAALNIGLNCMKLVVSRLETWHGICRSTYCRLFDLLHLDHIFEQLNSHWFECQKHNKLHYHHFHHLFLEMPGRTRHLGRPGFVSLSLLR